LARKKPIGGIEEMSLDEERVLESTLRGLWKRNTRKKETSQKAPMIRRAQPDRGTTPRRSQQGSIPARN